MASAPRHCALRDAVVGVVAALLVFVAVPAVLVGLVGLPVPHHWTDHDVVSWHGVFDLLAVVSWCAWAACAWPVLRSVAARVRSRDVGAAIRLSDRVAVRITLGVLACSSFLGLGMSVAGASAARPPLPTSAHAASAPVASAPAVAPQPVSPPAASPHATRPLEVSTPCVVGPRDTIASLAAAHYGAASDWPAIAAANLGTLMSDGTRFVDPSLIAPGWTLQMPELDADTRTGEGTELPAAAPRAASDAPAEDLDATDPASSGLPALVLAELGAAGISALVAGLLARRARQLRRLRAFLREEGEASSDPSELEADVGALVAPFDRIPLVDMVEVAARHLGDALATRDPSPGAVRWLRAGRDGVQVRFSEPVPEEVCGWRRTGHDTWLLPATVDVAALQRALVRGDPWCPTLLPLGDDDRGTWLLPVHQGTSVAVVGPRAEDLVLAMCAAATTWSWHEDLVVTSDVRVVTEVLNRAVRPSAGAQTAGPHVLFVGDPEALSAAARQHCAVLTTRPAGADVTVLVDDLAASAHPLGLTVRPPLLDASRAVAVEALTDPGEDRARAARQTRDPEHPLPRAGSPDDPEAQSASRPLVHHRVAPAVLRIAEPATCPGTGPAAQPDLFSSAGAPARSDDRPPSEAPARGRAEVRLLATVPGIVGLQAELPAKRARRALELIAYLAMHTPDPVTGDRLRTRVLGSSEADAAAKTLFNTVGAARRALGAAPDGVPLLPPASHSGHYRLSPLVTVDARRACTLVRAGLASHDPIASVDRLREALELVNGEPLGGVLTGYAWWQAEGHERHVADALVDGACALVRAALGSADLDLARWALAQARKVEPYSESLTRAAMRVAAAAGDARRLHAEWQECRRQMDELDPGGAPSNRTERLYALLRAQLAGDGPTVSVQASFAAMDAAPLRSVPSAPSTV